LSPKADFCYRPVNRRCHLEQTQNSEALGLVYDEWMNRPQAERKTMDQAIQFLFQITIREPEMTRHLDMGFSELLKVLIPEAVHPMH
jgi:hypothetical protein